MRKILFAAACILGVLASNAQFTYDYLRAADEYFRKADYFSAAQYYEKYLGVGDVKAPQDGYNPYVVQVSSTSKKDKSASSKEQAVYNLAESYRMLKYHVKAEPWYKASLDFDKGKFPLARYRYATTLRALEKFAEAESSFRQFLTEYTQNDIYNEAAKKEIANLQFIQEQLKRKDLNQFTVKKSAGNINLEAANYAPVWLDANTLLFTSTRADNSVAENQVHNNRMYTTTFNNGGNVTKLAVYEENNVHQGAATVTPDGSTMFFTRWTIGEGTKTPAIYRSRKTGNGWSDPEAVESAVNTPGQSAQQPFVMAGGKYLLYASNKPGGAGGMDLWIADLDAQGRVTNSTNLGYTINTKFDEEAPYYHEPSGTLVFSTNGRVGMGGFDFFSSKGTPGKWAEPVNLGHPVNSIKDDKYFASRGDARNMLKDVLISSDRAAACCLEMFAVSKTIPMKQLQGLVVACETESPLSGVTVRIIDTINNRNVTVKSTGTAGTYNFSMEDFTPLKAVAEAQGYHPKTIHFFAPGDPESVSFSIPTICLEKIPVVGEVIVLNNVFYEYNKAYVMEDSHAELDRLVDLMNKNPNLKIELSAHTDSKGSDAYNQKLSQARAQSVVDYLVSKGVDRNRMIAKGYGETRPIAPNENPDGSDNPEGRQKNRRTEFKVLSN